ncbi:hypothetical protein ABG768_019791, partial [Culter alburnus]
MTNLLSTVAPAPVNPPTAQVGLSACSAVPPTSRSCTFRSPRQAPSSPADRDRKSASTPGSIEPIEPVPSKARNSTRWRGRRPATPSTGASTDPPTRPGPGLSCTSPASSTRRK